MCKWNWRWEIHTGKVLGTENEIFWDLLVNSMADGALDPYIARSSSTKVLIIVMYKLIGSYLQQGWISITHILQ